MTVLRLAYFISSHGFGHAARAAAVMENLKQKCPGVEFEIFTQVAAWFFEDTLGDGFVYHEYPADVGIVQRTPWDEDLHATFIAHAQRLPFPTEEVSALSDQIRRAGCRAVLCDIAPLGIVVAEQAGLPSFLIENFTWDWIFEGYLAEEPRLTSLISYYRDWFARASYHIQTDPSCEPRSYDLRVGPVSRSPKHSRSEIRARLAIPETTPTLLITMGGIEQRYVALAALKEHSKAVFVIPGGASQPTRDGNLILLPHRSGFYHPDLLFASDVVIGKVGYSTIAEAYHAGIPFGYAIRERFRESAPLAEFIRRYMPSLQIPTPEFMSGTWVKYLDELLALPRRATAETAPNGAAQIATFILEHLD